MTSYTIDPVHSVADFKVRHMMITNVRGEFSGVSGTVVVDHENPANSKVEAKIDVNTIQTRDPQRDTHLKSADFLDAEKFPTITFVSRTVAKNGADDYAVTGDLTIHGVTKEVVLDVEEVTPEAKDPWGNVKAGAAAKTKINRKDFGLVWNATLETGGVLVGEDVQIHLDLQLLKQ
ncbi:MAG TPA: YceI family protein [Candidatus Acidoferrum sp.]|jgi:polyisoprenoid-binding protein YceI|nr:YceI family protein [Candidatus Acidoferrum sp.]